MPEKFPTDVDRHFVELRRQLVEDEVSSGSDIDKTMTRLSTALKDDGFSLVSEEGEEHTPQRTKTTVNKTDTPEYTVQAFRVSTSTDVVAVTSVFDQIDGWKTQSVEYKGYKFVIVTNAPRWSKKRVKLAIANRVRVHREEQSTSV